MIDDPDDVIDYHIASHIVRVHQKREEALAPTFTTAELKRYIAYAKTLKPKVSTLVFYFGSTCLGLILPLCFFLT
jgi:DNA replication licensing factor MCM6